MVKVKHFRPFFGNDVDIGLYEERLVVPVEFTQPSLDAVSDNCVAHFLAHGETNPRAIRLSSLPEQQEMGRVQLLSARIELQKFGPLAQAFTLRKNQTRQEGYYLAAMVTARR